jgi:hypothetical protein
MPKIGNFRIGMNQKGRQRGTPPAFYGEGVA